MTLTLEIAPEIERALEEKAQRAGVPLTAYAARVLARDVTRDTTSDNGSNGAGTPASEDKGAAFLALTAELSPMIAAGTLVPLGSASATALLDAVRDEREAELDAAFMGGARQ